MENSHKKSSRCFLCEFPIGSYVKLSTAVQPSWSEIGTTRHNFGRGPSNDYFIKVWFQLSNWFQTRTTVQLRCYWKQLWSRWAITGSWEPLVVTHHNVPSATNTRTISGAYSENMVKPFGRHVSNRLHRNTSHRRLRSHLRAHVDLFLDLNFLRRTIVHNNAIQRAAPSM
jgi:hypothetical protein